MDSPPPLPPVPEAPRPSANNPLQNLWKGLVAFVAVAWKVALPLVKLAKGGKILLTMGTMLLSIWFYSNIFGWTFAAGFVLCILVHEMGHVCAAWMLGEKVSAPIFIPGFGAMVLGKRFGESAWEGAIVGYGGPLFGTIAGLVCWGLYGLTGHALYLGLAFTTFLLNLFNLTPVYPLDGGRIIAAVSPYICLVGLVAMLAMTLTGFVTNPFIWVLIIMSLPNLWTGLRRGTMDTRKRTTSGQRATAGLAYVGLCGFLLWGMSVTARSPEHIQGIVRRHAPVQ